MTPERWRQIEQVFQSAIDQPPDERSTYLNQICGDDLELRREVESLLMEDNRSNNRIAEVVSDAIEFIQELEEPNLTGKRIGPYRITGVIGEGGMGIVFRAVRDDDEFQKQVALKVVKRGMDSNYIVSRFRKERQILADLDHPNIAHLLDGGSTQAGIPYFVMEYVDGLQLLKYCESNHLNVPDRLKLFQQICAAVQYAHQKLIIHRDIKPANVLVARDGTPKLLDFGIAKILTPDSGSPMATETMTILRLMTPDYASPEQVRGLSISTTTDIYSLGAILYELLTGQRPHPLKNYTPTEVERVICLSETEKPSTAARRSTSSDARIAKVLEGDLDNIVLMAMRKEPERRYSSAAQLSEDIGRYLDGLPVRARTDTVVYRTSKFVRRHKLGVLAVLLVMLSLFGGIIVANYQARRAERRFQEVRKLANTFLFEFHDSIKDLPGSTKGRELIVRTALEYLDSLAKEAGDDPSLQRELAEAYLKVGDVQGDPRGSNLGQTADAMKSYRKALALGQSLTLKDPENIPLLRSLATCYYKVGDLQVETGDIQGGIETLRTGSSVARKIHLKVPQNQQDLLLLIRTQRLLGDAQQKMRDSTAALQTQQQATKLSEQMVNEFPGDFSLHHLCLSLIRLGEAQVETGDLPSAIETYKKVLQIRQGLVQRNPLDSVYRREWRLAHTWLGNFAGGVDTLNLGDRKTAKEFYEKALSIAVEYAGADPKNAMFQHDLSICYAKMGDILSDSNSGNAIDFYRKAIHINRNLMKGSPEEFRFLSRHALYTRNIADPLLRQGDVQDALQSLQESIETLKKMIAMSPTNAEALAGLQMSRLALADALVANQDFTAAQEQYHQALQLAETANKTNRSDLYALWRLADSYTGLGRHSVALGSLPGITNKDRMRNWENARLYFQKSYEIWKDWERYSVSTVFNTSRRDEAAKEILRCENELTRLHPLVTSY